MREAAHLCIYCGLLTPRRRQFRRGWRPIHSARKRRGRVNSPGVPGRPVQYTGQVDGIPGVGGHIQYGPGGRRLSGKRMVPNSPWKEACFPRTTAARCAMRGYSAGSDARHHLIAGDSGHPPSLVKRRHVNTLQSPGPPSWCEELLVRRQRRKAGSTSSASAPLRTSRVPHHGPCGLF